LQPEGAESGEFRFPGRGKGSVGNGLCAKKACLWGNFVKNAGIGGGTVDCTGYIFP